MQNFVEYYVLAQDRFKCMYPSRGSKCQSSTFELVLIKDGLDYSFIRTTIFHGNGRCERQGPRNTTYFYSQVLPTCGQKIDAIYEGVGSIS